MYNTEPHDLFTSPNIIWLIKLRRMRWVGYAKCMGPKRSVGSINGETWKKIRSLQRLRHRWGIILKWILKELRLGSYIGFIWSRTRTSGVLLYTRQWTNGFHNMWVISRINDELHFLRRTLLHGHISFCSLLSYSIIVWWDRYRHVMVETLPPFAG